MSEPVRLDVRLPGREYPVWIGAGLLDRAGELAGLKRAPEVAALITDAHVAALHGARTRASLADLGARVEELTIEPGESSKSIAGIETMWRWLASIGAHRGDVVFALGGGVVGDLAGFGAATYHRGIAWAQLPTTLLGQVDASIGGKTAVDLPEGKNLVGAFHQPVAVVADTTALQTLPAAAFATGMAEVVKHGLISQGDLLSWLMSTRDRIVARDEETVARLVADAAEVKVRIVEQDETESGARMFLNYGHTLAHALEALGGYQELTHGEAVGIGMMFAAHLAVELGYGDRVSAHREALDAFGLPTGGAGHDFEFVEAAWRRDKKYEAGMRFIALKDFGVPAVVRDVPEAALRRAYEAVR